MVATAATAQTADAVRMPVRRRRGWGWRLLGLPFVLMFAGAGVMLIPGVVGVVMLLDRRRWLVVPGAALVGVTLYGVIMADMGGALTARQWLGVAVMLGCLAVLGWAARELVRRWRPDAVAPQPSLAPPSDADQQLAALPTSP